MVKTEIDPPRRPRPLCVTLLTLGVLTIAVWNLIRLILAVEQRTFLSGLLAISPWYLALTGLTWAATGFILGWGLWRGRRWAARLALPAGIAYSLYFWADSFLFSARSWQSNYLFAALSNLAVLIWIFWMASRPKVKAFFGETHDS